MLELPIRQLVPVLLLAVVKKHVGLLFTHSPVSLKEAEEKLNISHKKQGRGRQT